MSKPIYNIGGTSQGEFGIRVGQDGVGELRLIHDGVDAAIRNDTGVLYLKSGTDIGLSIGVDGLVDLVGPLATSGNEGTEGQVIASQGPGLPPVWSTAAGASIGLGWNFSTAVGGANPGSQKMAFNSAVYASVTIATFNDLAMTNFDANTILSLLQAGNRIYVQQRNDASKAVVYQVTAPGTDGGGYWNIPVSHINSAGSVMFPANADLNVVFILSAAGSTLADPTGTVGLTAVNGVATTAMRSDAAPPLSQAIVPTWSALHTFSLTPVVPNDSWTYAKIQNVSATSRVLGRITTGAGDIEELTGANLVTIIGSGIPAAASPTGTVGLSVVNGSALTWMRSDAAPPLSQSITPTWSATHTFSLTPVVPNDSWTYAKIQNVSATNRVLGRITALAGDIEELTGANLATIIGTSLGANPTASVGLAVVNGSAGTYMRSDAAPALSQAIAPTWTQAHIFNGSVDLAGILKASGSEGAVGQMLASQGTGLPAVWRSAGGGSIDMVFKFNTSTAGTDPGNQAFALNAATYAATTSIGFDILTVANFDSSTILGLLKLGNRIYIQQINDANRAAVFEVTAPATNNTGWWSVPVSFVNTTLAGTLYANNANCQCVFILSTSNPGGANPTASVGLTAVNGTSTNFIRSDGAPALSQSIAPTWSATHTFSLTPVVPNDSWTYAKIQNVSATSRVLGRITSGAGDIEELTGANLTTIIGGSALTKTDDTNVTLTLGGTPATALLVAASLTLGWTGTLAVARGGSGAATLTGYVKGNGTSAFTASATIPYADLTGTPTIPTVTPAALTKTDDTNVTLTLGGTPATALLQASSLTLGWTGTLAVARGGSGAGTLTGYLKGNGTSAFTAVATIPYADLTGTPTIPVAANPSGLIGMSAVNGVATTWLRSDGLHAIDPAIAPTWTGTHTFTASGSALTSSAIAISSTLPVLYFKDTDAAADRKSFRLYNSSGVATLDFINDAESVTRAALAVTLNNGVTAMVYGNATDNTTHTFLGTGLVAINGQASIGDGASNGDRLRLRNSSAPAVSTNYHHYFNVQSNTQLYLYGWDGTNATIGVFRIGHPQVFFADGTVGNPVIAFNSDQDNGLYYIGTNNWAASAGGAKVMEWLAAASGGAKVADTGGTMQPVGFRNVPVSSTTTTLAIGDVGKCIPISADINVPISVFAAGDIVSVYNDSGTVTRSLTVTAGGTLRKSGTTTVAPLTLAVRGMATLWFRTGGATPEVICTGDV